MEWFNLSLKEILSLNNKKIFSEILENINSLDKRILNKVDICKMYLKQLNEVLNNDFSNLDLYITFEMIYEEYEKFKENNTSHLFFYNHLAILYPRIHLYKATKPVICSFSGEVIKPNSEYIYYRPLLEDITSHKTYVVTPTIKSSIYYEEYLPKNILELEEFHRKLLNSCNDEINYYDVSCNMKTDGFRLQLLRKP